MRSPIERMIDEATGFDPSMLPTKRWVTMQCPDCKRAMRTSLDKNDPQDAVKIFCTCPDCIDGETCEIEFLDAAGNPLPYGVPDALTTPHRPEGQE